MKTEYRDYVIEYDPPPIGIRSCDWQFSADGYDGSPDSGDIRCGTGPTLEDCKRQIDEIENELDASDAAISAIRTLR